MIWGGGGEDESQIWSEVKRLDPYQGEHAVDLSQPSRIHLLSDYDLCSSNVQSREGEKKMNWHLFISKQWATVWAITSGCLHRRQLKETPGEVRGFSCRLRSLHSSLARFVAGAWTEPPPPHPPRVFHGWPPRTRAGQLVHKMADCKSPSGRVWQGHSEVSSTTRN